MRILYLPSYFFPEKAASNYLNENRNQAYADAGFDILTYTPTPCRGITQDEHKKYCSKEYREEWMYDGKMKVCRFRMFREGKNPIMRALRYFLVSAIQLWKGIRAKDIDLVYVASTPPTQGALAAIIKKCRHIPFVYNLQDIFPDSLVGTGLARKGGLLWKVGRMIEDFTYRNADRIIVISEDFKRNIMAKGVPEKKISVIYNWVDEEVVVDVPREQIKLFNLYGLDREKFYICYSGNIGLTQNMDMLLDVMEELQTSAPDIHLVLIGDGAYKKQVEEIVKGKRLENVHMLPFQPYEDISHVFSLGDVGLVISKPGVGANSVPSKTWGILSASRPVLASFDENELKDIIENNHCGIFTKAGERESFTKAILYLYQERELCRELGRNGRQFIMQNLTKEVGTKKYVEVIMNTIKDVQNTQKNN